MKVSDNDRELQLVGFDPNWVCVLYDLWGHVTQTDPLLTIHPNLDMEINLHDHVSEVPFIPKGRDDVIHGKPVMFGVVSPRNKFPVYCDFEAHLEPSSYSVCIAKSSVICDSCRYGYGLTVDHLCSVSSQTSIGFGVTIKRGAKIGHHNKIGDFVDINPGVVTAGNVTVETGCEIGAGAVINNNVVIGANSMVGMGSVVMKDIPPNSIAYGNPCNVVRKNARWSIPIATLGGNKCDSE